MSLKLIKVVTITKTLDMITIMQLVLMTIIQLALMLLILAITYIIA